MESTKGEKVDRKEGSSPTNRDSRVNKSLSEDGASSDVIADTITPQMYDILLGRGRGVLRHPGNIRMRKIVHRYRKKYFENERGIKGQLVMEAYHELIEGGSRFLKRVENDQWVEVDKATAIAKVGHCLRCIKNFKKQQPKPEVPRMKNNCSGDAEPSPRYQVGARGESFQDARIAPRPWGSIQQLHFMPLPPSISEELLWQRLQYRHHALAVSQHWLPSRNLLQIPHAVSHFDFMRTPFRIPPPADGGALELKLKIGWPF